MRACACAGRRGGVSTKGVLPKPAEAVPRSGTEQPEAKAGAASIPLKRSGLEGNLPEWSSAGACGGGA